MNLGYFCLQEGFDTAKKYYFRHDQIAGADGYNNESATWEGLLHDGETINNSHLPTTKQLIRCFKKQSDPHNGRKIWKQIKN